MAESGAKIMDKGGVGAENKSFWLRNIGSTFRFYVKLRYNLLN